MKEEELIKKLENTELPNIELQSHQRRLKMALLDAGYLNKRQHGLTILELAKSKLKGVKDTMIRGLISRQPVWKTATVSVLALALVLGLSLTIPSLGADSVYAQAAEIAKNSPEVLTAVGEVNEIQVIDISEIEGTVIVDGETDTVMAKVNLETGEVTEVVRFVIDDQAAIEIAEADSRVQALLDAGATISGVSTVYMQGVSGNVATGEFEEFCEARVTVEIVDSENIYSAHIDMSAGKVTSITQVSIDSISTDPPEVDVEVVPDPAVDGS